MKYSRQYSKFRNPKVHQTTPTTPQISLKKPLAVLLVFFFFLSGITLFRWGKSSAWDMQKIQLVGSTHIPEAEVQLLFQAEQQKNYFSFDGTSLIEHIKKQFPLVDTISLQKAIFPWEKTLAVRITEKIPQAIFQVGSVEVFIDENGVVISPVFGSPEGIVHIVGLLNEADALQIGVKAINGQMIEQIKTLTPRIEQLSGRKITRIEALDKRDYQFVLTPTLLIKCSTDKNMVTMLDHLQTILESAKKGGITMSEYIDLRTAQERVR
jgi:cell division septal protein FtsQ